MLLIKKLISSGALRYSNHANLRLLQRKIIKPEVEHVLRNGRHNKSKDDFKIQHKSWDYCVEGKTVDGRLLRIIVAIVEPNLLVITAIDL